MANAAQINLYANNQVPGRPPILAPAAGAVTNFNLSQQRTRHLHDGSNIRRWVQALQPLADSALHVNPNHRSVPGRHLRTRTKPLCYRDAANRTFCFNQGGLTAAQRADEMENSD